MIVSLIFVNVKAIILATFVLNLISKIKSFEKVHKRYLENGSWGVDSVNQLGRFMLSLYFLFLELFYGSSKLKAFFRRF